MARRPIFVQAFMGRWRIFEMDTWDNDYLDPVEPAFIHFRAGDGAFVFGAVMGWIDVRYRVRDGTACVEFRWEGFNDADPASGRGWAVLGTAGRIVGDRFHDSESSGFVAERDRLLQQAGRC